VEDRCQRVVCERWKTAANELSVSGTKTAANELSVSGAKTAAGELSVSGTKTAANELQANTRAVILYKREHVRASGRPSAYWFSKPFMMVFASSMTAASVLKAEAAAEHNRCA